mgnify:CR=1 FL=1
MMQAVNKTAGEPLWLAPLPPLSYLLNLYDASVRLLRYVGAALKDARNWLIFAAVYAVMTAPTWAGWLLFLLTGNPWHLTYSSAYMAFWALPFTPLIPLCIAVTLGIRKLIHRKKPPH